MQAGRTSEPGLQPWSLAGTYFEACNCETICPCRRVGASDGSRSTDGVCDFALSWHIEEGRASATVLDGLDVVLAGRFYDDPEQAGGRTLGAWEVALYLDERALPGQAAALEAIFLGRAGGATYENFAAAIDTVHAVRPAAIHLVHEPRRKKILVDERVRVVAREAVQSAERISCGIPGHDRAGHEWIAEVMTVEESSLRWEVAGKCGFASDFAYQSARG